MIRRGVAPRLRILIAYALVVTIAFPLAPFVLGSTERYIDLDGDPTNGAESRVVTRVLSSYPVQVENVVYNNADGKSYTFVWPGAGPGGFDSYVTTGPGVGTKWEWSTVSQVFSIESPAIFTPPRGVQTFGTPPQGIQTIGDNGIFVLPGKSVYPTQVTLSGASLASSLITFFSPEHVLGTCETSGGLGVYQRTFVNLSDQVQTHNNVQEDCCPEPNQLICDGECRSYLSDPDNCGDCGVQCASDEYCDQGSCQPVCAEGQILCDGNCVDPLGDSGNCGACAVQCAFDEYCDQGSCQPICPAGQTLCGEDCFDLQTDSNHCGACDFACGALYLCSEGVCEPNCPPGETLCTEIEACVNLQTDTSNCGQCGLQCLPEQLCSSGLCVCPTGETLCGQDCVDLLTDSSNCGTCGLQCPAAQFCSGGACVCPNGGTLCGQSCVDLLTDSSNCGACGVQCPAAQFCSGGACVCPAGETLCGQSCVNLQTDAANCGACGMQCPADTFCSAGSCACSDPALTLCGDNCVDLQTDVANCGACGMTCAYDEYCDGATCLPVCPDGYTLCGTDCVDITRDVNNCGSCGNVCTGANPICVPDCDTPLNCTGNCRNCPAGGCAGTDSASASFASSFPAPHERQTLRAERLERRAPQAKPLARETRLAPASSREVRVPVPEEGAALQSRDTEMPRKTRTVVRERLRRGQADVTEQAAPSETARSTRVVEPAPVCQLQPAEVVLQPGESYTECMTGPPVGKEVFTKTVIMENGKAIGAGPCAQIVPDPDVTVGAFLPSPVAVVLTRDDTGDLLPQPGENVCVKITVQNLGTEPFPSPSATLNSPPDGFNPLPITFSSDSLTFPSLPAAVPGTCETPPQVFPQTSVEEACFTVPAAQEGDVGRVFKLDWAGTSVQMPFVLGIGSACDPAVNLDGKTYDTLNGLQSPVNAKLAPTGYPVNISRRTFNLGSTIPLKLSLACGAQVLGVDNLEFTPKIVSLREQTLGPQSLEGINGDNNANPDDPFFSCGTSGCDYQFRTEQLVPGTYIVGIEMPDSRVFEAGFVLRP